MWFSVKVTCWCTGLFKCSQTKQGTGNTCGVGETWESCRCSSTNIVIYNWLIWNKDSKIYCYLDWWWQFILSLLSTKAVWGRIPVFLVTCSEQTPSLSLVFEEDQLTWTHLTPVPLRAAPDHLEDLKSSPGLASGLLREVVSSWVAFKKPSDLSLVLKVEH